MKIKIDFLKTYAKEFSSRSENLGRLMDEFEIVADEEDIAAVVMELRYYADLIESIPIA